MKNCTIDPPSAFQIASEITCACVELNGVEVAEKASMAVVECAAAISSLNGLLSIIARLTCISRKCSGLIMQAPHSPGEHR